MSTFDAAGFRGFATEMIERWGQTGTYRAPNQVNTVPVKFAWITHQSTERDGDIIRNTDGQVYVAAGDVVPVEDGYLIEVGGKEHRIVTCDPIAPDGGALCYDARVRA